MGADVVDAPVVAIVIVAAVPSTYPVVGLNVNEDGIVYVEPDASTKNPWPDAPKNASVVDCVDPVTGALTLTYSALSPVTVGVTVNVTTPLVLS